MAAKQYALVTGASSGIGESFARQLARAGHALVLVARSEDRLRALANELAGAHGVDVEVLAADLGDAAGLATVEQRLGAEPAIDLLINNAGFAAPGNVADLDNEALEAMLRLNIVALSRLSRAAMARMIGAGAGTIINVSSGTAFGQMPGYAGYAASKNYVMGFTRHMQLEAKDSGVRVQLLVPGVIATPFHETAGNDLARIPPERVMTADDLVSASLRALEMDEAVCIPSLPDAADWEAYVAAEARIWSGVSRDHVAARYR